MLKILLGLSLTVFVAGQASASERFVEVEVNGHFADGIHQVLTISENSDSKSTVVVKSGSYDRINGGLNYTTNVIGSGFKCGSKRGFVHCVKNEMLVGGPKVEILVDCYHDQKWYCDVNKTVSNRSWETGQVESSMERVIVRGDLVETSF